MSIRPLFILCIASSLALDYTIDLSMVIAFVLFHPKWRRPSEDVMLLVLSAAVLWLVPEYMHWRSCFPVTAPVWWQASSHGFHSFLNERLAIATFGEYRAFLNAVLLGDKSLLDPVTSNTFRTYGMSHMLAVSGFHIGFWVLLLRPITVLGRTAFTSKLVHFCVALFLLMYALTVGGSHSVFRAVWSYIFARWASILQLNIPSLHWPMLVAIGHFFVDPSAPRSLSFQLSYTAVFAILIALRGTSLDQFTVDFSPPSVKTSRIEKALLPVHISLAAWSATLPIVQHHFSGASPYFLIGNLAVVPLYTLSIWASVPLLLFVDVLPEAWCVWMSEVFELMQAQVVYYGQFLSVHQR